MKEELMLIFYTTMKVNVIIHAVLTHFDLYGFVRNICDWLWEKGHIHANNDFSV